jgi:hypothetical protein
LAVRLPIRVYELSDVVHRARADAALSDARSWPFDAPADDEMIAVGRLAAAITGVPIATMKLTDDNQHQLAMVGCIGRDCPHTESVCARESLSGRFVSVPDVSRDRVDADNAWVNGALAPPAVLRRGAVTAAAPSGQLALFKVSLPSRDQLLLLPTLRQRSRLEILIKRRGGKAVPGSVTGRALTDD